MKKAAPVKESGLEMMQANSSSWTVESHPTEAAALACFLSLATILQTMGISRESLIVAIDQASSDIHDAPEVLQ